nr:MAG TPA: hypothetical protein [Caudoviricetes sp.]
MVGLFFMSCFHCYRHSVKFPILTQVKIVLQ